MGYHGTFFSFLFEILFMAFLCVSQQGDFKNTTKNFLGKAHVKNFWPKKLRKKTFFLSSQGALKKRKRKKRGTFFGKYFCGVFELLIQRNGKKHDKKSKGKQ
jgi:hypothetical protein